MAYATYRGSGMCEITIRPDGIVVITGTADNGDPFIYRLETAREAQDLLNVTKQALKYFKIADKEK